MLLFAFHGESVLVVRCIEMNEIGSREDQRGAHHVQRQMAISRSLAEMIIQFLLLILLLGRRLRVCNELMQIHRLHERLHRLRHL